MNEAIQERGENTTDLLIMNDKDIVYKDSVMTPTIATVSNDTDGGYFGVQEFLRCTSEENNKQELNSDDKDKEILVRLEEGDPKTLLYLQEEDKDSVTCLKEGSRDTLVSLEDRLTVHGSNLSRPNQEKLSSNVTQNDFLMSTGSALYTHVNMLGDAENSSAKHSVKRNLVNKTAQVQEKSVSNRKSPEYILSIDVGTTNIRGHVYTKTARLQGSATKQQQLLQPNPGWFELDPQKLVDDVISVAKESILDAGLQAEQITCMGITTMRATFVTWDSETGIPFHNFISWQDLRAADYVAIWNKSYTLRTLNAGAKVLHFFLRRKRHLAASVLKFMSKQVTMRLLWALDKFPQIRQRAAVGKAMFGCIDTWLLWKLTGGNIHATDYSCASSTGLFDPFQMEWSGIVCGLLNIPMTILPVINDTSGDFGWTDIKTVGFHIPISAVVADQQGAMFGQCCFEVGDVKCTMGTGTFLDLNTGNKPHASIAGLYPLVGWKIKKELVFLAEGQSADTGSIIDWMKSLGLLNNVSESSVLAQSVPDSGGVVFVPAFSGLQTPFNDDKAVTSIFGLNPNNTKAHIVRAVLESLAFRFKALYETVLTETKIPFSHVRADGGVANNDFLVQLMADLVDQTIDRSCNGDMSCLGAAFLAGLAKGVWKDKDELLALRQSDKVFESQHNWSSLKPLYHQWENAIHRSENWFPSNY